jgi:hypothetical protein
MPLSLVSLGLRVRGLRFGHDRLLLIATRVAQVYCEQPARHLLDHAASSSGERGTGAASLVSCLGRLPRQQICQRIG